jgi:simple sugar transport system ATP-binding protein
VEHDVQVSDEVTGDRAPPALEMRGISKAYGPVVACDAVDLSVEAGEIHGLLGENGAGKSTLMKVLLGLVRRDAGTAALHGEPVEMDSPQEAVAHGVGMVHQHFSLIDSLTVWENVALGDTGRVDKAAVCQQVREVAARYGLPIDPMARVDRLSAGERQRVEILKCLRRDPRILILDEPTSVLTQAESAELFAVLRRVVRDEKRAVVLISHKLAEVLAATDRVTVLRRGRVVFRARTPETDAPELARLMVGRDVSLRAEAAAFGMLSGQRAGDAAESAAAEVAPVLRLRDVTIQVAGVRLLDQLSLTVDAGEILALYGVEGNGQAALGDLLGGLVRPTSGIVEVAGQQVDPARPGALHRAGLGLVPEDRHRTGLVLDMSVAENLAMKSLGDVSGRLFVRHAGSPTSSTSSPRRWTHRCAACPAATSSASCWRASCPGSRACSSPPSRPTGSTSARSRTCTSGSARSRPVEWAYCSSRPNSRR